MAASTADRFDQASIDMNEVEFPVYRSTHIYNGCCVMLVSGYLRLLADTSGGVFVGQATQNILETTAADGGVNCKVRPLGKIQYLEFDATSPAAATWLGVLVFASDDHTAALKASTTNDVCLGRCVAISKTGTSGKIIVDVLDRFDLPTAG